jgi:cytochrome c
MTIPRLVLAAALAAASTAAAPSGEELLQKNGCIACHALDRKRIGPSYKDVADKYRGDASAAARLAAKVKSGGAGVWGQVPMPPNARVSDTDLEQLVGYILSLN